ncbi:hypothetical protein [Candidatus Palauibacter sp.]|uniref:hypothetical protein n=1 Tax=Candidatus Palauibacter sp. TaxID=3101350 RepID=UPI003AF1E4BF
MKATRIFAPSPGRRHSLTGLLLIPVTTLALLGAAACRDSITIPGPAAGPNRAPEARGEIQPQLVSVGTEVEVDVSPFFVDPDGDPLIFSVGSSDVSVVTAQATGSRVAIAGVTDGMATVTVTGTDADGLQATQIIRVTVRAASAVFREEFGSNSSLSKWTVSQADATAGGGLRVTNRSRGQVGRVGHDLVAPLDSDWRVAVRMGREDEGVTPVLFLRTTDARFSLYRLDIGPVELDEKAVNYWFGVFDMAERSWTVLRSGMSEAIDDEPGELTEIALVFNRGQYRAEAGGALLFGGVAADWLPTAIASVWLAGRSAEGAVGVACLFDWVEIDGQPADPNSVADPVVPVDEAFSNNIN